MNSDPYLFTYFLAYLLQGLGSNRIKCQQSNQTCCVAAVLLRGPPFDIDGFMATHILRHEIICAKGVSLVVFKR